MIYYVILQYIKKFQKYKQYVFNYYFIEFSRFFWKQIIAYYIIIILNIRRFCFRLITAIREKRRD